MNHAGKPVSAMKKSTESIPQFLRIAAILMIGICLGALGMFLAQNTKTIAAKSKASSLSESTQAGQARVKAAQESSSSAGNLQAYHECPSPAAAALAEINKQGPVLYRLPSQTEILTIRSENGSAAASSQQFELQAGQEVSFSTSSYPVVTGSRAVDHAANAPAFFPATEQTAEPLDLQRIGRNGLLANPCVDPVSSYGPAYSRSRANTY